MSTKIDKTDAAAYVGEALRNQLVGLKTLLKVSAGEAHDLDPTEVAATMGWANGVLVEEADADDLAEDARAQICEMPLCVEAVIVHEIILGMGGPDDRFLVYIEGDARQMDITRIEYRYSWSGSAERCLSGENFDAVEQFARLVVPELIE